MPTMPTYVLICESCGSRQPFLLHEDQLADLEGESYPEALPDLADRHDSKEVKI